MTDQIAGLRKALVDEAWPHFGGNNQPAEFWTYDFPAFVDFLIKFMMEYRPALISVAERVITPSGGEKVQIKPLEWKLEPDRDPENPAWNVDTEIGFYARIFRTWWGSRDKFAFVFDGLFYHTEAAAKAAVQECYEKLLRAALSAPPDDDLRARLKEAQKEYAPLERLRRSGWMVAVHNDYMQHGEPHTFWLFTKGNIAVKGEGRTDDEALSAAELAARAFLQSGETGGEGAPKPSEHTAWRIKNGVDL